MYIERAVIKNLKGFGALDFTFRRPEGPAFAGWTVLTGDNGSGKTALLKALALAIVGPDAARALQPSWQGWVREGTSAAEIAVQIYPGDVDQFAAGRPYQTGFWSEVDLAKNGGPEILLKPSNRLRRGKKGPLNGPWADATLGWFSAGYGPFRRLYGASSEAQRAMSTPGRVGRYVTMFKEDASLAECEVWLKNLHHRSLEGKERATAVLDQVKKLLNDDFLRNGLRVDRVDSDGLWLRDPAGVVLPLRDMSDGYRGALALMADLLRHFDDVYRIRPLIEDRDGVVVVPHPGVVLIDEIDGHLHPAWQREIGFWLKKRFPNVQFIVTTHSPLVCQAADLNGIFHLPPPGSEEKPFPLSDDDYAHVIRAKADPILLSPAFGLEHTRSPRVVQARQDYARLQAKKRSTQLSADEKRQLPLLEKLVEPDDDSPQEG